MRVFRLSIDVRLKGIDDLIGLWEGVGVDRAPWLVESVGIVGRGQSQEDISSRPPIAVDDVVALSGGRSELAGWTSDRYTIDQQLILDLTRSIRIWFAVHCLLL